MIKPDTNRISDCLSNKEDILTIYFTAGYPSLDDTMPILRALENSGADMIEIGIPFSDPVADGPTIQESNMKALKNGMTVSYLFEQVNGLREHVTIPDLILSSLNPIMQFGMDKFCQKCQEVGINGLIIPDLPLTEYEELYRDKFRAYGLTNILLITPSTTPDRVRKIDELTDGFIYMVSSSSTTGNQQGLSEDQIDYFKSIQDMELNSPLLTGFGIYDKSSFQSVCKYSRGGIIGSAFIKALKGDDVVAETENFISSIR